ncbi:TPA: hypothetical protein QDZ97_000126 [Stenotrophomonas maltophilia]|nr:hypothetical protein [Stenotrophomonas maltophilia]
MSTDKTLADVQPGGRVRLGDGPFVWSDRAKADALEAGQYAFTEADGKDLGYTACIEACVDAICGVLALPEHRATLSAQPSPGGQGGLNYERMFVDACAALAEVSRELGCDPEQGGAEPILAAIAELRAALAARQPSKQPDSVALGEATEFRIEKGDRQPAGEQRAALWIQFAENGNIRFWTKDQDRALAESFLHARPLTAFYASPQQPAQVVDLERVRDEGHDGAIRYVLGYLNGVGDCGSTAYDEILNACGRERIIRSAVEDDELEFTGLGRWVEMYGTADDRALIDSQAVGNG